MTETKQDYGDSVRTYIRLTGGDDPERVLAGNQEKAELHVLRVGASPRVQEALQDLDGGGGVKPLVKGPLMGHSTGVSSSYF